MEIKIKTRQFSKTALVFMLLFFSNDTYLFGTNSNEFMVAIPRYLMMVFCIINFMTMIRYEELKWHKKKIVLYLFMITVFVYVSYINHEYFNRGFIKILCISTGLFICMRYSLLEYSEAFLKCMTFFSVFAVILTMMSYAVPRLVYRLPSIVNTVGYHFYSIGFAGIDERSVGVAFVRAGGIFWEPGVFQMYLNLAILFEIFLYHGVHKKRLIIFIISLILTFSTTGYLAFMWLIATYVVFGKENNRSNLSNVVYFFVLILGVFLAYFIIAYTSIGNLVFGKLFDMKDGSTMVRQASVLINLEIIRDYPWIGIGMDIMEDEFQRRSYLSSAIYGWTRQNTNTLLYQFSAHGIFWGIPFTAATYKFGSRFTNNFFMKVSIFVMFLMLYVGENLMISTFPYILIFYGIEGNIYTKK